MPKKRRSHLKLRIFSSGIILLFLVCLVYGVWAWTFDLAAVEKIPERS